MLLALMSLTSVLDFAALPGAVAKFERDYRPYEKRCGRPFPEEFKFPLFLRFLPKPHEAKIHRKSASGFIDYRTSTGEHHLVQPTHPF